MKLELSKKKKTLKMADAETVMDHNILGVLHKAC
jgi:hypothetical protein